MAGVVIIGSGLAGYQLARQFRTHDRLTPLTLMTRDDGAFYTKPMLSKALSLGKTADQLATQGAKQMADALAATMITQAEVQSITTAQRLLTYHQDGISHQFDYSQLVFACGAQVIGLPFSEEAGLLQVNDLADYRRFRQHIQGKRRVALIGTGLIGCEFANDLATNGYHVDLISPDEWPLPRLLPQRVGGSLQQALEKAGARFYLGQEVVAIEALASGYKLTTSEGKILHTEVVLSAIGLRPNIALAEAAGISIGRGILTDPYLATSAPYHYAIGDCAEVGGLLCQHIAPIQKAAIALSQTLAGKPTAVHYPAMPIIVKTSVYPVIVCPWMTATAQDRGGHWQFTYDEDGSAKGMCYDSANQPVGFLLSGKRVSERFVLEKQMPDWIRYAEA